MIVPLMKRDEDGGEKMTGSTAAAIRIMMPRRTTVCRVFGISCLPVGDNEVGFGSRAVNFPIQVSVIITY